MPEIRTDDAPRRLRAVWLGPRGKTLAFEWTYVQWLLCLGLVIVCVTVLMLGLWPVDHVIAVVFGAGGGLLLGVRLSRWAIAHTDYDRPLRWWRATITGEWRRSRRLRPAAAHQLTAPGTRPLAAWAQTAIWGHRGHGPQPLVRPSRRS